MKVLNYNNIKSGVMEGEKNLYWKMQEDFHSKYIIPQSDSVFDSVFFETNMQWQKIVHLLGTGWKKAKILDLGCGSNGDTVEEGFARNFQPWFCRFLHYMEVDVIGVDVGDLSGEQFKHYQTDLLVTDLTTKFPESYFDIVNAKMLFNSPELEARVTGVRELTDATFQTAIKLRDKLMPQIRKITKPEGYFIYSGNNSLENLF